MAAFFKKSGFLSFCTNISLDFYNRPRKTVIFHKL